ncbi:MAG: DUF222 domain-containing protein [Acidimicrobiales bacterium]
MGEPIVSPEVASGVMALAAVPTERLEAEITELAAHLNAAECRWLLLVAEFDRREGWGTWECRSCAHWLNWKCGIALSAAHDKVRVAHCLGRLSLITAAFAAGELSYSKVRALTRVATPGNEAALLDMARAGTAAHLERIVRSYRGALRNEEVDQANRIHGERFLRWHNDDDGSLVLRARLSPEHGALVVKALECAKEAVDESSAEDSSTGSDTRAQRLADALVVMAESFLATGPKAGTGGDRHLVSVHVDAEVLGSDADGRCQLEDGAALAAETARRLACDAAVVGIVEDGDENPLDVGRKTRSISPALRRALRSRDGGCRFPGCVNRAFVDGHHVRHWAQGGETSLANTCLLCRAHHRALHEGGYRMEAGFDGANPWVFFRPDGTVVPATPPPLPASDPTAVVGHNAELDIGPATAIPGWYGEHLDVGLALDALFSIDVHRAPPDSPF